MTDDFRTTADEEDQTLCSMCKVKAANDNEPYELTEAERQEFAAEITAEIEAELPGLLKPSTEEEMAELTAELKKGPQPSFFVTIERD